MKKNLLVKIDGNLDNFPTVGNISFEGSRIVGSLQSINSVLGYGFKSAADFIKSTLINKLGVDRPEMYEIYQINNKEKVMKEIMTNVKYGMVMNMTTPCLVGLDSNWQTAMEKFKEIFTIIKEKKLVFIQEAIELVSAIENDAEFQKSFKKFKKTEKDLYKLNRELYECVETIVDRNKMHDTQKVSKCILNMNMLQKSFDLALEVNELVSQNILEDLKEDTDTLYLKVDSLVDYAQKKELQISSDVLKELGWTLDTVARTISIYAEVHYAYRTQLMSMIQFIDKIEKDFI